jgi:hypothetical protein
MKPFFAPNLDNRGRLARGFGALAMFGGAWLAFEISVWLSVVLAMFGGFILFEALRGWCALRACGIKTRL